MNRYPLILELPGQRTTVRAWLEAQVELLVEAHLLRQSVAAAVLRGTGEVNVSEDEALDQPLSPDLARRTIARDHGYQDWASALAAGDTEVDLDFEAAADAIQWGDVAGLAALLDRRPELVAQQSPFPHAATLLHHVAANGIEVERQLQSPANAPDVLGLLLARGAEPDASCNLYGGGRSQTTLYLLVSSCVPAAAGVQAALVEGLVGGGARVDGVEDDSLPLWTAITFGYTEAVDALVRCGARVDNVVLAAATGDRAGVERFLACGPAGGRLPHRIGANGPRLEPGHELDYALIWAALHDRRSVVERLLRAGPDLTFREPCFRSTALGAARYAGNTEMVELLSRPR